MSEPIEVKPYTVFLTIGPSNAGKSYFCKNHLIPALESLSPLPNRNKVNVTYISSDELRRDLLGDDNLHKYHPAMLAASRSAFDLLFQKLKSAMMFPVIAEFIIVDTKGTNESFREEIYTLARTYRYGVVPILFNYNNFEDFGTHAPIDFITKNDIKKTREATFGLRRKPAVKNIIQLKNPDFTKAPEIICPEHETLSKLILPNDKEVLIVSDIHGCYDELVEILGKNNITVVDHKITENPNNKLLVIAGDYIDKGPKLEDTIDFLYENPDILVIIGNHENRLYKELTQDLEHIEAPYFDSYHRLDDQYKQKFIEIFERSISCAYNDMVVITHAPCHASMLGKIDKRSMEGQRYFPKSMDENISIYDDLNKIHFFDSDLGNILHVFGHIPTSTPGKIINRRMLIDGGCDDGGFLVSVSVTPSGKRFVKYVESHQPKSEKVLSKYTKPDSEKIIDLTELDFKDRRRIWKMCANKVNFISGTMSPCDKLDGMLESIASGIRFFKDHGVTDIVMQPKYMGSRCNMYLFSTNEESYAVSRNGYKIRNLEINPVTGEQRGIDLNPIFDKMRERLSQHFNWSEVRCVIIDGELMPWSALGDDLIEDFNVVADNVDAENQFLKDNHFDECFVGLKMRYEDSEFNTDKNNMPKADMIKKYGNATYNTFKAVASFKDHIPVKEREELNKIYKEQMVLYGSKGEIDYKPFAILKIVYHSGEEKILYLENDNLWTDNETMFNLLNPDGCHRYNLEDLDQVMACIEQFLKYTTEQHYEGVVLKPNKLFVSNTIPPYLKVRNPDYLSIIYGYDYLTDAKHEKLCVKKTINGKLKASIQEWKKGIEMLKVNYNDLNEENNHLKQLYASFIAEEAKEQGMDPRL